MKIYKVLFMPLYPVPNGLIIAANNYEEAYQIAKETITHADDFEVSEVDISNPCVILYESGDY